MLRRLGANGPLYKPLMKRFMHRKTGVRELIDEWRAEGIKEADAFGEGWRQDNEGDKAEDEVLLD